MEKTWMIIGCSSGPGKGIAEAVLRRGTDRAAITARDSGTLEHFSLDYPGQVLPG